MTESTEQTKIFLWVRSDDELTQATEDKFHYRDKDRSTLDDDDDLDLVIVWDIDTGNGDGGPHKDWIDVLSMNNGTGPTEVNDQDAADTWESILGC